MDNTRTKVLEDGHCTHQILGPPTFMDVVAWGSYAHRPH